MRKLRLDIESLTVQTFDTVSSATTGRGTVRGHDWSNQFTFCFTEQASTCEPAYTCPECAFTLAQCPETEICP
jgi:hypothetical protein